MWSWTRLPVRLGAESNYSSGLSKKMTGIAREGRRDKSMITACPYEDTGGRVSTLFTRGGRVGSPDTITNTDPFHPDQMNTYMTYRS